MSPIPPRRGHPGPALTDATDALAAALLTLAEARRAHLGRRHDGLNGLAEWSGAARRHFDQESAALGRAVNDLDLAALAARIRD